jgi:hypothetical protein
MKGSHKLIALVIAVVLLGTTTALGALLINPRQGYAPYQPIYFQHLRMAGPPNYTTGPDGKQVNTGGYNIPCVYCHTNPYKGRHSTVPAIDICMNCHEVVGQNREWVLKMKQDYWDKGKNIPWVKVHDLPDFVYYDHAAHLNAVDDKGKAKVECADCHGKVEETNVVSIQNAFNMGWCIDCHRKPEINASTDCIICHR